MKRNSSGFTLIELMVAVLLLTIVMITAVPYMRSILQNNRVTAATNDLITVLNLARSEAIKRGVTITVCPAANSNYTSCGNNWSSDWIIFVDPDGNGAFANNASEPLLRVQQMDASMVVSTTPAVSMASYSGQGFAAAGTANLVFSIAASNCTANHARTVSINAVGRISVTEAACP